ncbi:hypothetical protein PG991_003842 [Apiospora marii]|uniref:Uncharacterized protein n=1 Tax=Apiospora marii TaxID=335849 RepID=A0ABR1S4R4_9PEZI
MQDHRKHQGRQKDPFPPFRRTIVHLDDTVPFLYAARARVKTAAASAPKPNRLVGGTSEPVAAWGLSYLPDEEIKLTISVYLKS